MQEEYKKVNEYEYKIPKSGKMLVPATIYASDALFEGMKDGITLKQIKNVAALPGIQKKLLQ